MESRALKLLLVVGGLAALAGAGWWLVRPPPVAARADGTVERLVPEGTRIRVEVINQSDVTGLARRATLYLRDVGFDVVRFTSDTARRDSALVVDRTGHPEWARLASRALGGAPVRSTPDSLRYVDLTVLLGRTWRPPAQAFYP